MAGSGQGNTGGAQYVDTNGNPIPGSYAPGNAPQGYQGGSDAGDASGDGVSTRGIGGALSWLYGGENEYRAKNPYVDPNAFQWGGQPGGLQDYLQDNYIQSTNAQMRQGAQIDNGQYNADRGLEMGARGNQDYLVNNLRGTIEGNTPSVAQAQMQQGLLQARQQNANALQASQAAAASQAASARGGGANLAAAQRQAAMTQAGEAASSNQAQAQMNQQSVNQSAMLRAQEIAQAQSTMGSVAANQRAQDLQRQGMSADQAYKQATIEQQQHGLNDQMWQQYNQLGYNAQRDQLEAQMQQQKLQSENTLGTEKLNMDAAEGQAGRNEKEGGGILSGIGGALGMLALSDIRAKKEIKPGAARVEAALDAMHGVAPVAAAPSGVAMYPAQPYAGPTSPGTGGIAPYLSDADRTALARDMSTRGNRAYDVAHAMTMQAAAARADRMNAEQNAYAANVAATRELEGMPTAPAVMSDERTKTGVGTGDREVERAMDHLRPYSYRYKDPTMGEGQRVGVMAQDLEKSPIGLSAVIETPRGKAIDMNQGLSLSLAGLADLHERVRALETKRGR